MAAQEPLSRLVLAATSVADDLGFVALADLAGIVGSVGARNYRVIGGHMVSALVARWQLGAELYRETGDVDLGVPPIAVKEHALIERLADLGYTRRSRGTASTEDDQRHPSRGHGRPGVGPSKRLSTFIIPAYTSRDARTGGSAINL